jgi:hypothetical protein
MPSIRIPIFDIVTPKNGTKNIFDLCQYGVNTVPRNDFLEDRKPF